MILTKLTKEKTFLMLSLPERLALVARLNDERVSLASLATKKRIADKQPRKKKEKPSFEQPWLNDLFSKLDPRMQKLLK